MNYTRVCGVCQEELPANIEYFHRNKNNIDGLHTHCKKCRKKHDILYRKNNVDKIKQQRYNLYIKNKKQCQKQCQEYYIKNKEKIKKYKQKNQKKTNLQNKKKYKLDPVFRIRRVLSVGLSKRLRIKNIKKHHTTIDLLGCSIYELKNYLEKQFQPGMTWENYGFYGWHIDHIVPCSSFDLTDIDQQKKCFHYTNLQPLWASDNLRKSDKFPYIFE
jgi:hypothetical protein